MNGNPMPNNVLARSFRLRPDNVVQGAGGVYAGLKTSPLKPMPSRDVVKD
jgi:hypothetical protein